MSLNVPGLHNSSLGRLVGVSMFASMAVDSVVVPRPLESICVRASMILKPRNNGIARPSASTTRNASQAQGRALMPVALRVSAPGAGAGGDIIFGHGQYLEGQVMAGRRRDDRQARAAYTYNIAWAHGGGLEDTAVDLDLVAASGLQAEVPLAQGLDDRVFQRHLHVRQEHLLSRRPTDGQDLGVADAVLMHLTSGGFAQYAAYQALHGFTSRRTRRPRGRSGPPGKRWRAARARRAISADAPAGGSPR